MFSTRSSVSRVAISVLFLLTGGCAAHEPPAGVTSTFVRGIDGPGGPEWPTAPDVSPAPAGPVMSAETARELAAGPRAKVTTGGAESLEASDTRLGAAVAAAEADPTAATLRAAAEEYRRVGVFDRARRYLAEALTVEPGDAATSDALAKLWRDWGVPGEGLSEAYRAVAGAPRSAEAQNTLGTVLVALGHGDAAMERFELAASLDRTAAYAENNLCYGAFLGRDEAGALAHCQRALELDPSLAAARNNLGLVHAAAGRWGRALDEFRAATPDESVAQYNLGIASLAGRDYLRAADAFDDAVALNPDFVLARARAREARRLAAATDRN